MRHSMRSDAEVVSYRPPDCPTIIPIQLGRRTLSTLSFFPRIMLYAAAEKVTVARSAAGSAESLRNAKVTMIPTAPTPSSLNMASRQAQSAGTQPV